MIAIELQCVLLFVYCILSADVVIALANFIGTFGSFSDFRPVCI